MAFSARAFPSWIKKTACCAAVFICMSGIARADALFDYYKKLADDGNINAIQWVGTFYAEGDGVEQSQKDALKWYKKVLRGKDPKEANMAKYNIALVYYNRTDVEPNYKKALKWFKKAASDDERINTKAAEYVSYMYEEGLGTSKNDKKAFQWNLNQAKNGGNRAAYYTGMAYLEGRGIPVNMDLASQWFYIAAKGGNPQAQYQFGLLQQMRAGEDSCRRGEYWLRQAQENGYEKAAKARASSACTSKTP